MREPIDIKTIPKAQLSSWLGKLENCNIIAPVKREKYFEYTHIKNINDIDLSFPNTVLSPKGVLFEQTKKILKFNLAQSPPALEQTIENENDLGPVVLLGIRPCDAQAILAIDKTFDAEFKDPYYLAARKRTTLVGLACTEPDVNCFCASVNFDPFDGAGLDIMMFELGDNYLFNIYSTKGQELIKVAEELFNTASADQLQNRDMICEQIKSKQTRKVEISGKPEKLGKIFESKYWEEVARKCLGCGICTYLCPTCYCFDITDERHGAVGERVRTWDSCMYSEYTVHASGYNPRPARMNRLRNRVFHKYKYYPDLYNMFGCTGCGRCIRYCPVNIDIIDIVNGVDKIEPEAEAK
ncbi:4Fe-4S dicluster domain-containing protein [[Eubacterium] cellulosolvens]